MVIAGKLPERDLERADCRHPLVRGKPYVCVFQLSAYLSDGLRQIS